MPRKTHTKSRYGCDNCRRRRVKCDEQGPPCNNCVLRRLPDCRYSRVLPANLLGNGRRDSHETNSQHSNSLSPVPAIASAGVSPASLPLTSQPVDDLELMLQFTTETYQSLCISDSESVAWQKSVPRLALAHRYLMYGIFSLASLHLATTTTDPIRARLYVDAGLEYHSKSLEPFRVALDNLSSENCDAVFAESVVTAAICLALPQLTTGHEIEGMMINNVVTAFQLLQGVKKILVLGRGWIKLKLFVNGDFWRDTSTELDQDTQSAFEQLFLLNDQIDSGADQTRHNRHRDIIKHLRHCFMKFLLSPDPAPVLAWLGAVDNEFVNQVQGRSAFPLLILAHWGVLLAKLDGKRWWARNAGRALVDEVMSVLERGNFPWQTCMGWVRRRMALHEHFITRVDSENKALLH
ncbi:hypothetical protein N7539_008199 [Penicillium diatomitis]|uniref:Zn(2)-C6 fungal-type domain-containing protein n=1 Tax=Penicillium diatomitis TaxID=2819901 RepID=A0A9W9WTU5_9EURO|nr:uncharacterized protein N7539_008199 [Penicillium diatomitis]KAJ5475133.1 hypothetical protein N7539_008199 [Penicillium diatomitis]